MRIAFIAMTIERTVATIKHVAFFSVPTHSKKCAPPNTWMVQKYPDFKINVERKNIVSHKTRTSTTKLIY